MILLAFGTETVQSLTKLSKELFVLTMKQQFDSSIDSPSTGAAGIGAAAAAAAALAAGRERRKRRMWSSRSEED